MKTTKQLTFLLVLFLSVCIVSIPALSGEHPWDSDGDDTLDDNNIDSTMVVNPKYNNEDQGPSLASSESGTNWFSDFITSVSLTYTLWYIDLNTSNDPVLMEKKQHKHVVKRDSKKMYR